MLWIKAIWGHVLVSTAHYNIGLYSWDSIAVVGFSLTVGWAGVRGRRTHRGLYLDSCAFQWNHHWCCITTAAFKADLIFRIKWLSNIKLQGGPPAGLPHSGHPIRIRLIGFINKNPSYLGWDHHPYFSYGFYKLWRILLHGSVLCGNQIAKQNRSVRRVNVALLWICL